jgi:hemoglobin/transferrin/lactoferrin receptor protein
MRLNPGVVFGVFLGCVVVTPAAGQEATSPPPGAAQAPAPVFALDEISVSATKTPRDPLETPGEVNVIPREELDRAQAQRLSDVLRYQPGVDFSTGPRRIGEEVVIRGLSDNRVLWTIDGARLSFQFGHKGKFFIDPDLLGLVEIVRGPVSALYGGGALGGVVALTTRDPADVLAGARVSLTGKVGYQGVNDEIFGGPILAARLTDGLEVLLHYTYRDSGDIELGDGSTLANSAETLHGGLFKTVWRPTRHDRVTFSALIGDERGRVPINVDTAPTALGAISDRTTRQEVYTLAYHRRDPAVAWLDLAASLYWTRLDIEERRVSDGRLDEIDFDTYGFDVRNTSRFRLMAVDRHALTYGVEYFHDRQRAERNGGTFLSTPDGDTDVVGLYLQDEITLWERLTLIPGARWDHYETRDGRTQSESQLSPKVGAVLKATEFLFLEASYAQGFRAPTFGDLFISGTHFPGAVFVPNPDLKPEKSENVEVGFRVRADRVALPRDRVRFRNTYFWNRVEDFIELRLIAPGFPLQFQNVNVRDARIEGYEAELLYQPLPDLTLLANYTRIRGEDRSTGEPLASIPADKAVLGVDYRLAPLDVTLGARVQIVDAQDETPAGVPRTAGYTVYDLYAFWTPRWLPGFRVDAGVDNVTDKRYRRPLAVLPEAGINPKVAVSYTHRW